MMPRSLRLRHSVADACVVYAQHLRDRLHVPSGTVTLLQEIATRRRARRGRFCSTLRRRPDATAAFKGHGRRTDGSRKRPPRRRA